VNQLVHQLVNQKKDCTDERQIVRRAFAGDIQ
jgi:hypothetical protein